MNLFADPRIAPSWIAASAVGVVGCGAVLSLDRLQTTAYEVGNTSIASVRANSCRVLNAPDKIQLGAYYLQPTQGNQGILLGEGTYLCDVWGTTARIERGGYAQLIKIGDATEVNKTLTTRLADPANPDSNPNLRPRRDISRGIYQPQPKPTRPNPLFSIGNTNETQP